MPFFLIITFPTILLAWIIIYFFIKKIFKNTTFSYLSIIWWNIQSLFLSAAVFLIPINQTWLIFSISWLTYILIFYFYIKRKFSELYFKELILLSLFNFVIHLIISWIIFYLIINNFS